MNGWGESGFRFVIGTHSHWPVPVMLFVTQFPFWNPLHTRYDTESVSWAPSIEKVPPMVGTAGQQHGHSVNSGFCCGYPGT